MNSFNPFNYRSSYEYNVVTKQFQLQVILLTTV